MATRSRIGMVNEDGTVSSIYCHWDGYPSNNGKILLENYKDRDKVKRLIDLGPISSLNAEVSPGDIYESKNTDVKKAIKLLTDVELIKKHSFESPMEGVTVAYHRDRGEDYNPPRINESLDDYFEDDNEEYGYLFVDGEWLVKPCYGDRPIQTVKEALAEET